MSSRPEPLEGEGEGRFWRDFWGVEKAADPFWFRYGGPGLDRFVSVAVGMWNVELPTFSVGLMIKWASIWEAQRRCDGLWTVGQDEKR
jgi:hypothetical protein